ncbi:hypothetical protein SCALM49S_00671 [Streptomyces californicus]
MRSASEPARLREQLRDQEQGQERQIHHKSGGVGAEQYAGVQQRAPGGARRGNGGHGNNLARIFQLK